VKVNLYFPRSKVQLTAIPKTGCTSVLSFFTALELNLESQNEFLNDDISISKLDYSFLDPLTSIHVGNSPLWKYWDHNPRKTVLDGRIKAVTLRNPYDRFTSFWLNKIVYAIDPNYFKLAVELLPPSEEIDFRSIQKAAHNFLLNLTPSKKLDAHIRPQHMFLSGKAKYNLSIKTKNIQNLPSELSSILPRYRGIKDLEIPKLNFTDSHLKTKFLNPELVRLIEQLYHSDFELLKELDLNYAKPEIENEAHIEIDLRERTAKLKQHLQRPEPEVPKLQKIMNQLKRLPGARRLKRIFIFIFAFLKKK
jgi:hypothetical protein